jgi:cytochrome c peroxidase
MQSRAHPQALPRRQLGRRRICGALAAGFLACAALIAGLAARLEIFGSARAQNIDVLAKLRASFARPSFVPNPAGNVPTAAKVALGKRLFEDTELSSTGTVACASCHDPKLSFSDGEPRGHGGITRKELTRHTPSLWNVAWSPLLFWDGRASRLEDQVRFPVTHPDEMGSSLENAVQRFSRHESYTRAFKEAFPEDPDISPKNMAKAIAAYERTLVSPPIPFDAWVAGDDNALSQSQISGLRIFAGKGRCMNCHNGFALTDHGFYDVGLPGKDRGRGLIIGLAAADHAFKTPTLRELAWTAPYMHDGSLATLEEVVRHYEKGGVRRSTRSRDLPQNLRLKPTERADLIAFLESLSSDTPPQPSTEDWIGASPAVPTPAPAASTNVVTQINKLFKPDHIQLRAGQTLTIANDDTRTHNVRIYDPRLDYNSGALEPHENVTIRFPVTGTFEAFCGIHPTMRLRIEVR